jgi:hypothetical protein
MTTLQTAGVQTGDAVTFYKARGFRSSKPDPLTISRQSKDNST